ncbi:hemin binding protein Hbp [Legionella wadsworthii]|uniref:Hemin binding protein Hbp n=1 Tax=Legionella wadsworthii TaxID=28088 RepID=A0A378LR92_9GAMM|nr:DUF4949 domain-containing protein [Legionella wadsworthii]STY28339.1 hemin binding protein Hbp [Legionella wadsworthii]
MKLQVMNAVLLLSLSQFSFGALPPKPNACPSVSALKAIGVSDMIKEDGQWYGAVQSNNYNTTDKWTFVIGAFRATDESDAKQQALRAINSLSFLSGPEAFNMDGQDSWICGYKDRSGHTAATITPTMPFLHSGLIHH